MSRSFLRAAVLPAAALSISACTESLKPLDVSPEEFESIGQAVAIQIETGVFQLEVQEAMGNIGAPQLSVRSNPGANISSLSFLAKRAPGTSVRAQAMSTECGVPSQDPPVDSDNDFVPDNLVITFSLPACSFEDETGSFDLTGAMRVWDPVPSTAAAAFNLGLDNFRVTFEDEDVSGYVRRDGLTSVVAATGGLSQTVSWLETAQIAGLPTLGADTEWIATFVAAQGQSVVPGAPLPDGTYQPNGSFEYRVGPRTASFSVTTLSPLQYDASCAADVVEGFALTPFTSGTVRVAYQTSEGRSGAVDVTYSDCFGASVEYVP